MTAICGYTDRFQYDKSWWRRWCWLTPGHRGSHFDESEPRTASEAFQAYVSERNAARDEALIEAGPPLTIISPAEKVDAAALPASPKKVLKWVEQNAGWTVLAQHSRTHRTAVLYVDSTGSHNKGDVRTAAHDRDHWAIQGRFASDHKVYAEFWASWWTTLDANGKPQTKFEHANIWDQFTGEHIAEIQTEPFNDWLRALAPKGAPKPRAPRATKDQPITDQGIELLETGTWSAA